MLQSGSAQQCVHLCMMTAVSPAGPQCTVIPSGLSCLCLNFVPSSCRVKLRWTLPCVSPKLIRRIIGEIYIVWKVCSRGAKEGESDSLEPRDHAWSPWEHIYSLCKASKGHMPLYNPYGKYVVRLFWMVSPSLWFFQPNLSAKACNYSVDFSLDVHWRPLPCCS